MAIDWSDIHSRKVREAMREILGDKKVEHAEVVDMIEALMKDGELDGVEINDLQKIAKGSATMPVRSKKMLQYLGLQAFIHKARGPIGIYTDRQKLGAKIIFDFLKGVGSPKFPRLDRDQVGIDLLYRVANPNVIDQGIASICGPVGFLYSVALDAPANYARYAVDLFEWGRAKLGKHEVAPSHDARHYLPPAPMTHGEWLTAGSLRDSANAFFDYDTILRDGGTDVKEVVNWMGRAGYTDIKVASSMTQTRSVTDIRIVNDLLRGNYRVILLIHSDLLNAGTQARTSTSANHYVVMRSPIEVSGTQMKVAVYSWGNGQWNIPAQGTQMTPAGFTRHWYGYIAAKPS